MMTSDPILASIAKLVLQHSHWWQHSNQVELAFTCATETLVELLVTQLLTDILSESELSDGVPVERFGLKIGRFEPAFIRSSSPSPPWEKMKAQFKFSSVLDKEDIENMIVHLKSEMSGYELAFQSSSTLRNQK
ncbi:hypothetical protein Y032_0710g1729 [Ancylostoma ceylanicum]|uniref:Uncharacterized protein n=1 Tax=Ancylostoma ceylanicum TaxID=53326 RepID=A0A016WFI6_9BILA|nr:hypothetical protein Y032_0710g1729 [Ancylostoma ceylanicum]